MVAGEFMVCQPFLYLVNILYILSVIWFTAGSFEIVVEGQCTRNVPAEAVYPKP